MFYVAFLLRRGVCEVYLDTDEEIRLILEGGWNTLNGRDAVAHGRSRKSISSS